MRQTKRGQRLITKKSKVSFQPTSVTSTDSPSGATAAPTPVQVEHVPEPTDIPNYHENTFDEQPARAIHKGKVSISYESAFRRLTARHEITKSQNDFQREYLAIQDEYLHRQLEHEALPPDGLGSCGHLALWRCLSCHSRPTFCLKCCREAHQSQPLHRIEFWGGSYYRTAWLRQLGIQIHCGHGGSPCPQLGTYSQSEDPLSPPTTNPDLPSLDLMRPAPTPISLHPFRAPFSDTPVYGNDRMIVVVDLEGVHELPFTFCCCPHAPRDDIQLLDLGYYPASVHQPKTVFTTRLLDDFLLSNKECKTAARNYYTKLRRTTNPTFPHMVPDRYKELLRVSRQWRNQQMRKNAGFAHRQDAIGPGDLAVRCPACPQPDVNLPVDWKNDDKQWKYTRSIVLDGNFSAQHRKMRKPEDDVALADGHAFMVTDAPYKEHLKTAADRTQKSTCHDHRAVMTASMDRGNLEATGIGAAACSRHGFFAPHACVDFQQGERYRNMDYILHWIFAYPSGLTRVLILYDIMCQYFIHLYARFKKSPHLHMPPGLTILRGIGQFHVHGHIPKCFPRFSLNFIQGAGVQDGEIIETLWNKTNAVADSTRGMSAAHRREVIDDHMNDSNWMKLTRITTLLIRKWKRACRESQPATAAFEELNAAPDPEKRVEWEREAEAAEAERDATPSVMDIYDVSTTPLPTRKDVQVMLAQEELNEGADGDLLGAADWIATGLRVEETKYAVRSFSCPGLTRRGRIAVAHTARHVKATSGSQTRLSLREDADAEAVPDLPADTPEVHPIGLPSTFGIEFLAQMNMLELAKKERQLREGQLNDALQGICTGIGYKSLLYRSKVRNASSYRAKLRSFDDVHVADEGVRKHVRVYQHSRQVMERLFDPDDPEDVRGLAEFRTRYREIRKEDLRVSTAVLESFTPGLRNEHSAWFWNISDTRAGEETQWIQDYRRMLWLRAYARKAQWDEEIVLVPFEMDCTIRSFEKRAADWEKWMGISPTPGHTAFAQRQVAMWFSLRDHATGAFSAARTQYLP
ncbi:hypothetical protein LXA43DRAFT_900433 [Ganoderma leucocontextum]|nr:hypothetical protein LXA43DRAFT_900433 [Ganoderma leucocontextum]